MNISEETFTSWSQGPGKTEADKCENAETAVRKAIAADAKLSPMGISVFAQGSYKARTNVRQDSDVDICVRHNKWFFPDYPKDMTKETFGNIDGELSFPDFKDMVEKALKSYFGENYVRRGNKAFDVHANTYRIDADVVPAFEHRRYTGKKNSDGSHNYLPGVAFKTDSGGLIINWPEDTYDNGVARNDATGRSYKRVIRILKRLRNKMQDENIADSANVASFLIECLVWNAPVEAFNHDTYTAILRHVIADVWNRTRKDEDCSEWGEVNELKYLFRPSQPWTREQTNGFLEAAWNYIGFK
ncbi:MAG: nucleotidyltransferase [Verrucomicrobia bacterium]|nr:nucleotidyltransferase [Verrucomicrobiota bacterium]